MKHKRDNLLKYYYLQSNKKSKFKEDTKTHKLHYTKLSILAKFLGI